MPNKQVLPLQWAVELDSVVGPDDADGTENSSMYYTVQLWRVSRNLFQLNMFIYRACPESQCRTHFFLWVVINA